MLIRETDQFCALKNLETECCDELAVLAMRRRELKSLVPLYQSEGYAKLIPSLHERREAITIEQASLRRTVTRLRAKMALLLKGGEI